MPMDKGFNRLAWFLPYVLGASGALWSASPPSAGRGTRRRWRAGESGCSPPPLRRRRKTRIKQLEARLDDELRDLD